MRTANLALALVATMTLLAASPASSQADNRRLTSTHGADRGGDPQNPIKLEGQIRSVEGSGDAVTIRLHRDRYPIVASSVTRVRWNDGRRAQAGELRKGDSIRVEGDLDRDTIYASRVTILMRVEHHGGN